MNQIIYKLSNPFPHLIVENMYNQEELNLIWEELNFLTKPNKFLDEDVDTAIDRSTNTKKSQSKSLVIDDIYVKREISNILTINRKLFNGDYLELFSEINAMCKSILYQNYDLTKIRYYENGDQYLPHVDIYNYTAITFFYKNPKAFDGGNLVFSEYNYTIDCKDNCMILFPSFIEHTATQIKMNDNTYCNGRGRYSMMQFMKIL